MGAIGQSLGEFSERAKRAAEIERKLTEGQTIVELDAELIDPSFVADRMPMASSTLASLTDAIRNHGQLNPIPVRPSTEQDGRFQVSFGHRRLAVAKALGQPVRAVVRPLSDEELVIAQGQENHEREDLSYIEKSLFAHRLEQRGFSRATIMTALSVYKSDLSNMLSVATKIPADIVSAIGPAPATGSRGWIELGSLLTNPKALGAARKALRDPNFGELDSDARFKRVLGVAKPQTLAPDSAIWSSPSGRALARITQSQDKVSLTIDRRRAPDFAQFVLTRLLDLYLEFEAGSQKQP